MALLADRGRLAAGRARAEARAGFWTEQAHGRVLLADHLRPLHEECARSKAELAEIEKEEAKGDACAYLEGAPPYDPSPPPPPTTEEELAADDGLRRGGAPCAVCGKDPPRASRSTRPRRRAGGRGEAWLRLGPVLSGLVQRRCGDERRKSRLQVDYARNWTTAVLRRFPSRSSGDYAVNYIIERGEVPRYKQRMALGPPILVGRVRRWKKRRFSFSLTCKTASTLDGATGGTAPALATMILTRNRTGTHLYREAERAVSIGVLRR